MRATKYIKSIPTANMLDTGCDWLRGHLGMATTNEIEATLYEMKKAEEVKRDADSFSLIESEKREREEEKKRAKESVVLERYHVIVGSFKEHSNATRVVKRFEERGYTPHQFDFHNGFKVVSVAAFRYLTPAYTEIFNLLDLDLAEDDAWIYDIQMGLHKQQ